jgi:hypothetical protein
MPATSTKVKFRVRLCPDRSLADKPADPTWPRPKGVIINLTPQGSESAQVNRLAATGSHGGTSADLEAGEYTPTLAAGQDVWKGWECSTPVLQVEAGAAQQTVDLRLVPSGDRRLLAVRLVYREDPDDDPKGISGLKIKVLNDGDPDEEFGPSSDAGDIYALAPSGNENARVRFSPWTSPDNKVFDPVYRVVTFSVPGPSHKKVSVGELSYRPAVSQVTPPEEPVEGATISIVPEVEMPSGSLVPFTGATVTVDLQPDSGEPVSLEGTLATGQKRVSFENQPSGVFGGMVVPPDTFNGWPVRESPKLIASHYLPAEESVTTAVPFVLDTTRIEGHVLSPLGTPLEDDLRLAIFCPGMRPLLATASKGTFTADVPTGAPWKIRLGPQAEPELDGLPLQMAADQEVLPPPQVTTVTLEYEHYITGQTVDEARNPMPYAVVDVFDGPDKVASAVSDQDGLFVVGLKQGGSFIVAVQTEGGEPVTGRPVTISSGCDLGPIGPRTRRALDGSPSQTAAGPGGGQAGGTGPDGSPQVREAFTDLAAYPVLTEEVSTTGIPGPAPSGPGTAGADYGQVVDQAMRDVLGWRPSTDVSGFQAALTGAFQLREVEGHTEWTWQQRGYAVQADMGALTGAQASIYARAKSALDQILPLLSGLTTLNPALCPPQDLEAIRTVITAELQELVTELALPGGPRIQRVDQLFHLLTGAGAGSRNLNPDLVQGNLGTLRNRFGLTVDEIDTVDEERIVTNFRIVVEQVLTLQASWSTDRGLLAPLDPRASFGTVLIWLSRSLEAVCESVSDLTFALDSVFVDAAQRQVIELKFPDQKALLLSDLLDWVDRASRDEGPRIIQDAGKDGVFAFAPVLRQLRDLVQATRHATRHGGGLPHGMRTPRVDRALQVLITQLSDATDLAGTVRRDPPPLIEAALVFEQGTGTRVSLAQLSRSVPSITVDIFGANFRPNAAAVLIAQDRQDLPELHSGSITVTPPNLITTTFRNPTSVRDGAGVTWLVAVTNEDGTQSNQFPI